MFLLKGKEKGNANIFCQETSAGVTPKLYYFVVVITNMHATWNRFLEHGAGCLVLLLSLPLYSLC